MEKKKKATYTLPESLIDQLKKESKERNLNMSVLVQLAVENFIRKEKNV